MTYIPPVAQVVSYVNNGGAQTVAQLLANYPANSTNAGKYAVVSDLYNMGTANGITEIMRCRFDAVNNAYRWVPQRQEFARDMSSTGGTVTLSPLISPPTLRLMGALVNNMTVTPSATNAWVGMRFRVVQNSVLGLFVTSVTGLIGSNLTLLGNAVRDLEYGPSGWFAST